MPEGSGRNVFGRSMALDERRGNNARVCVSLPFFLSRSLSFALTNANTRDQGIVKLLIGFEVIGGRNRSLSRDSFLVTDLLKLFVEASSRFFRVTLMSRGG